MFIIKLLILLCLFTTSFLAGGNCACSSIANGMYKLKNNASKNYLISSAILGVAAIVFLCVAVALCL